MKAMKYRQQRRAAYHEAAHAVARIHVGASPAGCEIRADGTGDTHGTGEPWRSASEGQYAAWEMLTYKLAGGYAEARVAKASAAFIFMTASKEDMESAQEVLIWLVKRRFAVDTDAAWLRAENETRRFLRERWADIERVAIALIDQGRLEPTDVVGLVQTKLIPAPQRT